MTLHVCGSLCIYSLMILFSVILNNIIILIYKSMKHVVQKKQAKKDFNLGSFGKVYLLIFFWFAEHDCELCQLVSVRLKNYNRKTLKKIGFFKFSVVFIKGLNLFEKVIAPNQTKKMCSKMITFSNTSKKKLSDIFKFLYRMSKTLDILFLCMKNEWSVLLKHFDGTKHHNIARIL